MPELYGDLSSDTIVFHLMKGRACVRKDQNSSSKVSLPEADAVAGGVTAVTRSLHVLEAFEMGEPDLPLAELSRRTGLHNSTVLRLARTLALSGYMVQNESGAWRLGPAAGWLGARYQAGFDVNNVVEPTLRELSRLTQESASFYVREGDVRACISRVEGPQAVRHHVRIGARLPLNLGSPGRIILAFSGEPGKTYEEIRRRGYLISVGGAGSRRGKCFRASLQLALASPWFHLHLGTHVEAQQGETGAPRPGGCRRREQTLLCIGRGGGPQHAEGGLHMAPMTSLGKRRIASPQANASPGSPINCIAPRALEQLSRRCRARPPARGSPSPPPSPWAAARLRPKLPSGNLP